ncbi:MAG: CbiX/SirB N-terminal domain-containing protein [Planctomycetaceae bacterium]
MSSAILLIAHGSRRPAANADLLEVARRLGERRPGELIEVAYLELAEPDIPTGARRCVERGAREVRLLPWFLSAGAHVRDDLERYRREFTELYDGVRFACCPPLGIDELMIDVLQKRLDEADGGAKLSASDLAS